MRTVFALIYTVIIMTFCGYVLGCVGKALGDDKDPRIHIGIVDTGFRSGHEAWLCKDAPPKDFTNAGVMDRLGHGSNVAGLIARHLDVNKYCFIIAKWVDSMGDNSFHNEVNALRYVLDKGAKYVNLSLYGPGFDMKEFDLLESALSNGVRIIASAGNNGKDLSEVCNAYPGCYSFMSPNFYVVGYTSPHSNYGGPVNAMAPGKDQEGWEGVIMSGTSMATANFTGELAAKGK